MFFAKPVYTSSTKIMSSHGSGSSTTASGIAAHFGISLPTGQPDKKWVYPEILKSILQNNLRDIEEFYKIILTKFE